MADKQKMTPNLNIGDPRRIDLLVEQGNYGTRTGFIRLSIRNHLGTHAQTIEETVTRRAMGVGLLIFTLD
ncbi:MAG: hypothetical protein PVF83_02800 [Anaerolineales bacterium]|jgi:hypothetical protein